MKYLTLSCIVKRVFLVNNFKQQLIVKRRYTLVSSLCTIALNLWYSTLLNKLTTQVGNWQAVNLLYTPYMPCYFNGLAITLAQKNLLQVIEKSLDNFSTFCIHCTRYGITILLECLLYMPNNFKSVQWLVWLLS